MVRKQNFTSTIDLTVDTPMCACNVSVVYYDEAVTLYLKTKEGTVVTS